MRSLRTLLVHWERSPPPNLDEHLRERLDALDLIELHCAHAGATDDNDLHQRARQVRERLEADTLTIYRQIQDDIRAERGADRLLRSLASVAATQVGELSFSRQGYDLRDEVVAGILQLEPPESPLVPLVADMVAYQPTPARQVLDLIGRTQLGRDDVLIDLGSGLGHVPLLAAICTPARCLGIELEPTYVHCARAAAQRLGLGHAQFLQQDVREADLSAGTVFYLYTPFGGDILREVLATLRRHAQHRALHIATFGPCTETLAREPWLTTIDTPDPHRLTLFTSRS